jgi:hypothetical protein
LTDIWSGIVVGGAGGAIAGLTVSFVRYAHSKALDQLHKRRVYNWLKENTKNEDGAQYRSTRAVASWNNLTEDRARYVCSIHKKIYLSTGKEEDMWSLYERGDRSVDEKRGMRTL